MATLLSSHLEQISRCASSIADLPFPPPGIFANALLAPHDITALLRDTEQHERALFHLAPPPLPKLGATDAPAGSGFTGTAAGEARVRRAAGYGGRQPRNKAVAAVLGGDLYQQTRKTDAPGRQKGDVDVEVLLHGAEKLAAVYPIPGASERITQLRRRHQQLEANIAHYEARVAEQTRELQRMRHHRPSSQDDTGEEAENEENDIEDVAAAAAAVAEIPLTKEDLAHEEEEVRELENKKRGLEERVTGMERDLGGLMR